MWRDAIRGCAVATPISSLVGKSPTNRAYGTGQLLALAVVMVHVASGSMYRGIGTTMAVQCFYAISGFLMALA